jgi:hypothetical protein
MEEKERSDHDESTMEEKGPVTTQAMEDANETVPRHSLAANELQDLRALGIARRISERVLGSSGMELKKDHLPRWKSTIKVVSSDDAKNSSSIEQDQTERIKSELQEEQAGEDQASENATAETGETENKVLSGDSEGFIVYANAGSPSFRLMHPRSVQRK